MVMTRLRILTKEERDLLEAAKSNKDFVKTFIEKFGWDVFHPTTLMGIYTHKKEYLKKYDESVLKTALPKDPPVFKSVVLPISEKKMEKTVEELFVEILNEMKLLNSFTGRVKKP